MKHTLIDKRRITLVVVDFYGNPYQEASGWPQQNAIGQLWKRFNSFYTRNKDSIKNQTSESGYEVWIDFEEEEDSTNDYFFISMAVGRLDDVPLELVAKILAETRYAMFTSKVTKLSRTGHLKF